MAGFIIGFARHAGVSEECRAIRRTTLSMGYEVTEAVAQAQREAYFAMMPSKVPPPLASVYQPPTAAPPTPATPATHTTHITHSTHTTHAHQRQRVHPRRRLRRRSRASRGLTLHRHLAQYLPYISPASPRDLLTLHRRPATALPTVSLDLRAYLPTSPYIALHLSTSHASPCISQGAADGLARPARVGGQDAGRGRGRLVTV